MSKKSGELLRFAVKDSKTGRIVRDEGRMPVFIKAFTAKSARHEAKRAYGSDIKIELAR